MYKFWNDNRYLDFYNNPSHSINEISNEWDTNVVQRAKELEGGLDYSYIKILKGFKNKLLPKSPNQRVLDVGCGLGFLTNLLSERFTHVVGIDISIHSINYASSIFLQPHFINWSISQASKKIRGKFDICCINMVLHNIKSINQCFKDLSTLLNQNGLFIITVPHPEYWMKNKLPIRIKEFQITENYPYKIHFKIRNGRTHPSKITYYHRNTSTYINSLTQNGFSVCDVIDGFQEMPDILAIITKRI